MYQWLLDSQLGENGIFVQVSFAPQFPKETSIQRKHLLNIEHECAKNALEGKMYSDYWKVMGIYTLLTYLD